MAFMFLHETIKTHKDRGLAEFSTFKLFYATLACIKYSL